MKLLEMNIQGTKRLAAAFPMLMAFAIAFSVFYIPEAMAAPVDARVDELDAIFTWLKKIFAWGFYLIGSGAGLNFGYRLAAIQNFKSAGISATAAALCLGLGAKLSATAII
jgi:hypothetical protein